MAEQPPSPPAVRTAPAIARSITACSRSKLDELGSLETELARAKHQVLEALVQHAHQRGNAASRLQQMAKALIPTIERLELRKDTVVSRGATAGAEIRSRRQTLTDDCGDLLVTLNKCRVSTPTTPMHLSELASKSRMLEVDPLKVTAVSSQLLSQYENTCLNALLAWGNARQQLNAVRSSLREFVGLHDELLAARSVRASDARKATRALKLKALELLGALDEVAPAPAHPKIPPATGAHHTATPTTGDGGAGKGGDVAALHW
eukprot:INCI6934.1.p1 GENE.INCI6934.1~~INCI6934.1.p1  ORF type:complete len:263 (-),score=49.04 INCI6934.1:395-1183(-)